MNKFRQKALEIIKSECTHTFAIYAPPDFKLETSTMESIKPFIVLEGSKGTVRNATDRNVDISGLISFNSEGEIVCWDESCSTLYPGMSLSLVSYD